MPQPRCKTFSPISTCASRWQMTYVHVRPPLLMYTFHMHGFPQAFICHNLAHQCIVGRVPIVRATRLQRLVVLVETIPVPCLRQRPVGTRTAHVPPRHLCSGGGGRCRSGGDMAAWLIRRVGAQSTVAWAARGNMAPSASHQPGRQSASTEHAGSHRLARPGCAQ